MVTAGGGNPIFPPLPPGPPHAPWPGPGDGGPPAPPPGPPPADQPEPDLVNQPYDGGGHVRERLRPKESDEVNILAFPTGSQWRAWGGNTFASIVSAAGRQDDFLAKSWIQQVETADPAELEYPGEGWVSHDRKLAAALAKMAHGEIGREVAQKSNTCLNNNTIARGRVLLAIVFRYYASGQNGQAMYDMNHLQSLVMKNDNLEAFHNTWNLVLSELSVEPEHGLLQNWYFRQIEHFKPMSEDIAHYKRAKDEPGNLVCYFAWFWAASCRYLLMKLEEYMQQSLKRSLTGASKGALGPDAAPKGGGGKGLKGPKGPRPKSPARPKGDKPKGNERGRSATPGRRKGDQKQPCYAFQKGTCVRGKDCGYSHAKVEDRGRSATPKPGGKAKKVCAFHASGNCKFGDKCRENTHYAQPFRREEARRKGKGADKKGQAAAGAVALPPPFVDEGSVSHGRYRGSSQLQ